MHLPNMEKSLHKAAQLGHGTCLQTLTQAGADVNSYSVNGKTAIILASYHNRPSCCECVKSLLEAGADVNRRDHKGVFTPLMLVTRARCKLCVELLLNKGADVNAVDAKGNSPLIFAIHSRTDTCVASIIEAGADVNKSNKNGESPISKAALFTRGDLCLSLLINAGADVNTICGSSCPLINIVATRGDVKGLDILIEAGADVNCLDANNNTPLIAAADPWKIYHQAEKAVLLLRSGAKINVFNKNNHNALMAHINWQYEVKNVGMEMNMLLFAAGETIDGTSIKRSSWLCSRDEYINVPNYLLNTELKLCLKHLCREAIREHLLYLDPHTHLFGRVPKLGLPKSLTEYLLYDQTLNNDDDNDNGDDDDFLFNTELPV